MNRFTAPEHRTTRSGTSYLATRHAHGGDVLHIATQQEPHRRPRYFTLGRVGAAGVLSIITALVAPGQIRAVTNYTSVPDGSTCAVVTRHSIIGVDQAHEKLMSLMDAAGSDNPMSEARATSWKIDDSAGEDYNLDGNDKDGMVGSCALPAEASTKGRSRLVHRSALEVRRAAQESRITLMAGDNAGTYAVIVNLATTAASDLELAQGSNE